LLKTIITDKWNRPLHDLRISVTDRCNFRCQYCMPADQFGSNFIFLPNDSLLTFEEIERLATIFARLGVKKLRLTGGEPLLRKDLPDLVEKLSRIKGIEDIGLTTNGFLLSKFAHDLKKAGLKRVNISLDSLNDELFGKINGRMINTKPVLDGIAASKEEDLSIKINMVVKKGLNDAEIIPMAEFCKKEDLQLRYIEFMDVGSTNEWKMDDVATKKEIYEILTKKYELEILEPAYFGEVAKQYRYKDSNLTVGFINSVSESFCGTCTRARLSASGQIYTCLFNGNGFDLRKLLRNGIKDEQLQERIIDVWLGRMDRYSEERTAVTNKSLPKIEMSFIGG
jgi:GTP 3',8-cyclase